MRNHRFPGWRSTLALLIMSAVTAAASGCSGYNDASGGDSSRSKPQGDNGARMQKYSDDGYLGITSSYPHVPGRHMALNYASDARLMRDAIRDIRGVAGADITFHGAEAFVAVRLRPGLSAQDAAAAEQQAASVLRFNFPRYTMHVRTRPEHLGTIPFGCTSPRISLYLSVPC